RVDLLNRRTWAIRSPRSARNATRPSKRGQRALLRAPREVEGAAGSLDLGGVVLRINVAVEHIELTRHRIIAVHRRMPVPLLEQVLDRRLKPRRRRTRSRITEVP